MFADITFCGAILCEGNFPMTQSSPVRSRRDICGDGVFFPASKHCVIHAANESGSDSNNQKNILVLTDIWEGSYSLCFQLLHLQLCNNLE